MVKGEITVGQKTFDTVFMLLNLYAQTQAFKRNSQSFIVMERLSNNFLVAKSCFPNAVVLSSITHKFLGPDLFGAC